MILGVCGMMVRVCVLQHAGSTRVVAAAGRSWDVGCRCRGRCSAVPWVAKVKPIEEGSLKRVVGRVGQIKAGKEQWNGGADGIPTRGRYTGTPSGTTSDKETSISTRRGRETASPGKRQRQNMLQVLTAPGHVMSEMQGGRVTRDGGKARSWSDNYVDGAPFLANKARNAFACLVLCLPSRLKRCERGDERTSSCVCVWGLRR